MSASSLQVSPGPGWFAGQPGTGAEFTLRFSFWAHVSFAAFKRSPAPSSRARHSVTCCPRLAGLCSLPPQLGLGSRPRHGSQKTAVLSRHSSILAKGNSSQCLPAVIHFSVISEVCFEELASDCPIVTLGRSIQPHHPSITRTPTFYDPLFLLESPRFHAAYFLFCLTFQYVLEPESLGSTPLSFYFSASAFTLPSFLK